MWGEVSMRLWGGEVSMRRCGGFREIQLRIKRPVGGETKSFNVAVNYEILVSLHGILSR